MIVGVGVDTIEIARVAALLERYGARFRRRVFTEGEQRYCDRRRRFAQHYAARFAAKEALLKALGIGLRMGVRWRDIEVVNLPDGKPTLRLHGRTAERAAKLGTHRLELSLTHAQEVASAFLILETLG
ncbi:MAG: holo-ACP synthase [Candidatus Tectomicrobia bacterium]|nr:holo-ACP synthase [Candidatus Tectomicrobia bacterium]